MAPSSFGLPTDYKKTILEEIFALLEYCHVSWTEAWDMPIVYRHWLLERKKKEVEKRKEESNRSANRVTSAPPRRMGSGR